MITIYKIRDTVTGKYSHGIIDSYGSANYNMPIVNWSKKGKEWTSEKLVQNHIKKCIEVGGFPSTWEILEFTQQPSRSLTEWVNSEMLMSILKHSK